MQASPAAPTFPSSIPTHPLLVVDYELIKHGNSAEIDKLWDAGTQLGFWYLKNHGADEEVAKMFEMGAETMALPLEAKMAHEQGNSGNNFGYKAAGANVVDVAGNRDTAEFINVAKDDALMYPQVVHRAYPRTVNARMRDVVRPFTLKSIDICGTLLSVLNARLGLPEGRLPALHRAELPSFCQSRCTKSPPVCPEAIDEQALAIGPHTDYGSLSFLHNRLGGLQVMPPGTDEWCYVKPVPGYAICNVGDALAIFSGGILRSNLHRVVNPPEEQAAHERWSLVYFQRPHNGVLLEALVEDSPMIAEAVARSPSPERFTTGQTAEAWLMRRVRTRRADNVSSLETWKEGMGTEHTAPSRL